MVLLPFHTRHENVDLPAELCVAYGYGWLFGDSATAECDGGEYRYQA